MTAAPLENFTYCPAGLRRRTCGRADTPPSRRPCQSPGRASPECEHGHPRRRCCWIRIRNGDRERRRAEWGSYGGWSRRNRSRRRAKTRRRITGQRKAKQRRHANVSTKQTAAGWLCVSGLGGCCTHAYTHTRAR